MRKRLLTFITIVMAAIIGTSSLSACNLVTTDVERDMNQVVATVQINENAPYEEIKKRDMISAYLNYGYMYEQYYGYTREQVFSLIIDNLVQNRVFVQNAMAEFEGNDPVFDITLNENAEKWSLDRYLTEDEIIFAQYSAKKQLNSLIDSYEEVEDEEEKEDITGTVRPAPTNATNAEKEDPSVEEQENYKIDADSSSERRKAFNKVVKLLENNNLLGASYNGNIENTEYYKDTLISFKENKLLEKYEDCIRKEIFGNVTFEEIQTAYVTKYEEQKEWTNAEFVTALSSASASEPILVSNENNGYGFVYNLLLGASDEQTTAIGKIDKKLSVAEKAVKRAEILKETKVKDLRSSWILSGYDFDGTKFTGDYTFTSPENSLPFNGIVTKVKDATDELPAEYKIDSVTEYGLDAFLEMMETYVYGSAQTSVADTNPSVYRKVNTSNGLEEYDERINELLFAFSTDDGSLNTYKGYAIKPIPDGANSEQYMQEFADAGRELLKMGDRSYVVVATDYGYHVMFYSEQFNGTDYQTLTAYLDSLYGTQDWQTKFDEMMGDFVDYEDTDSYLYLLTNSVVSTRVSNKATEQQRKILNKYVYDEDTCGVTWYKSRYADLLA